VYLANYWTAPKKGSSGYLAFQIMRNADGEGGGFGDVSGAARSEDTSRLSSFAATDSRTGDLTILLINKMRKATVHRAHRRTKRFRFRAALRSLPPHRRRLRDPSRGGARCDER
jgi:hypothetical protein